jgi:Short C-terminal domain
MRPRHRNLDLERQRGDGSPVKIKPLHWILSASFLCVALIGRASSHDTVGNPVSMDNHTYSITCEATNAFMRDEDVLKADASAAAAKFCAAQGKQLKVISITSKMPNFSLGYGRVKITFMALDANDPMLLATVSPAGEMVPARAPRNLTTDELVAELTKLDDLRKKGILTDEEFQAEKKKVLSHSN